MVKVSYCNVYVDDQDQAMRFYCGVLGFEIKHDIPLGEYRWLTVTAPGDTDGPELLLEPDVHPAVKAFKSALVEDGIPLAAFEVDDVWAEVERLDTDQATTVVQRPTPAGEVTIAVVDDTCGNLIQLFSS
ncbi:VOC family protein [Pseudonocardia phyllosphaerae]|uniref:VOC family protein n=1 Tax=Pseudonocardia phyllosphaerae TaxID=3390502 RepID=UPI00397E678F